MSKFVGGLAVAIAAAFLFCPHTAYAKISEGMRINYINISPHGRPIICYEPYYKLESVGKPEDVERLKRKEALSDGERILLEKLVEAEAGNQSIEGRRRVVDVVYNRVANSNFPDSIEKVIYQKGQFAVVDNGRIDRVKVSEKTKEAVKLEIEEGIKDPEILYFTAGGFGQFGTPAYSIGNHYFCTE